MARFNVFENGIDFSPFENLCCTKGSPRTYCRGEFFAHTGEVIKRVGWIESGSFKHCLIDDTGGQKSVGFVFAGSALANYTSAVLRKPVPTDIIALEDSKVYEIPVNLFNNLLLDNPGLNLSLAQGLFAHAYDMLLDNYRYSAHRKYDLLLERYPRIFNLVPLSEIASYLNISRRQLHRFRSER